MRQPPIYEDIATKQTMNRVTAPGMPFDWSINPYRGCTHGCSFCYARVTHTYLGMEADDSFRSNILVKANAAEALEQQLERRLHRLGGDLERLAAEIGLVTIGTATDPYQPIEAKRQITRQCLEVLAEYQVPTSITTRSPLILRDLPILKRMRLDSINISVHTLDKQVWRNLEPATPAPEKRLAAVRELVANGLPAGVFLAPIVPYLTDSMSHLRAVAEAAAVVGARFLVPSILRLTPEVKRWFMQVLCQRYPELVVPYQRLYRGVYPPVTYARPVLRRAQSVMAEFGLSGYIRTRAESAPMTPYAGGGGSTTCTNGSLARISQQLELPI
ncbi:MAG: radical SAM protein [Alicyclobacillus herbarius]|uniref:SPL family radical SAM protein n=1 Tax=Alicyclobacillus herbarius TaxID=122960 RepID=UPI0023525C4F|nr:radical SAM protein [Alicyclobacillus herbarius]MCL6632882.1 radical SAM protein [Alicyclobacillus herbarius]